MPENAKIAQAQAGDSNRLRLEKSFTSRMRFCAILPVLRWRAARAQHGEKQTFCFLGREVRATLDEFVRSRAFQVGVSARTLYRWLARFESSGLAGLKEHSRRDKGILRKFSGRQEALAFIVAESFDGHTAACIHRKLADLWPAWYRGASRPPSRKTISVLIDSLAPVLPRGARRKSASGKQARP